MSAIRNFFASIAAWFASLFSKTTTITPGPAAQPASNVVQLPTPPAPTGVTVPAPTLTVAPGVTGTGTLTVAPAPGVTGTATIGGFSTSNPTAKPATPAPIAPVVAVPAEKPFDPAHPDPTEFFAGSGRWMTVNGTAGIIGPISPGHYTTFVGEGNQVEGSITIDGVVTPLWGRAFTVVKATTASLTATGEGTIQLQRLAAVNPLTPTPFFQVPPSK